MKKNKLIVTMVVITLLSAVTLIYTLSNSNKLFLKKYNLNDKKIEEVVAILEEKTDEPAMFNAAITGTHLIMKDDRNEVKIELPSDSFYLSVAPYIDQTHPCGIHNLVSCRGELQNQVFNVVVVDKKTHEVVFDQEVESASNGFLGLWLPKNMEGIITVSASGLSSTAEISTFKGDDTCLTTLQLS